MKGGAGCSSQANHNREKAKGTPAKGRSKLQQQQQ